MAKGMKVKMTGIKSTQAYLISKLIELNGDIEKGMGEAGRFLQNEVKSSIAGHRAEPTSVDTGRFLNSVDMMSSKREAIIFTKIKYAKHLEYGTSKIKARRHFNNSKDRNKNQIINIIKDNIRV